MCKILQKEDVDMFTFDFTRTMGEETSRNDLFQVVEELKNGHVVSVLYGNPMEVVMTSPHVVIFTNEKEEQLLVDGFTGKKSKEAAGYQKAIDFLKGRELEIREMRKAAKQNKKTDAD